MSIRIGVSGHQKFSSEEEKYWVQRVMSERLNQFCQGYTGISCLAAGTDQLFAEIVLRAGFSLEEVLPCRGYIETFRNDADRKSYESISAKASRHHRLEYPEPTEEAFLRAGQFVVEISDFMFFVWNGRPAEGRGGTEDIVKFARNRGVLFTHINPENRLIL